MSHSEGTTRPSRATVVGWAVLTGAMFVGTMYSTSGIGITWYAVVGFLLGLVGILISVFRFAENAADRSIAKMRDEIAERERIDNTGTWTDPETGRALLVRYDRGEGAYFVTGSLRAGWDLEGERWPDRATLGAVLADFERDGYAPADDPGTRSIRARLMLPGWDDESDEGREELRRQLAKLGQRTHGKCEHGYNWYDSCPVC